MRKIVTVLGARPQFVKAAAVSRAINKEGTFKEIIVHTGQHFDKNMSEIFFNEMEIPRPDYQLDINSLSHGAMTGRMLEKIEEILIKEEPEFLVVYGDTNSTIAGALAASKLHIDVVHIEAGLRSFNFKMPEEQNRILTDHLAKYLFCSTKDSLPILESEGIGANNKRQNVHYVGDVMYDTTVYYSERSGQNSRILNDLNLNGPFVLTTIHRQENTDDPERLKNIITSLNEINKTTQVVFPLHPRTKKILEKNHLKTDFQTIDPVGYFDILELMKGCEFVVSDSGGMQKEAYFLNKSCLVARDETEWVELTDNGFNFLVGADPKTIHAAVEKIKDVKFDNKPNFYGNADSADLIVKTLANA